MSKLTAESVTAAIRDMNGNISAVAKRLGVCRQTVYSYIERHPSVKDVLAEARETMIDNAESALYRAVLNGEAWAVCFFLKTQGKGRGYVERQEVVNREETLQIVTRVVRRAADD